jgi:hypothetical protein
MKKLKVVVGINSLTECQWPAYNSHLELFYNIGKRFPQMDLILVNPSRVGIDRMRNLAAQVCIESEADYLLFIDDDVIPPFDSLQRLIACEADIAAGDVLIRGYPFDHMCFRWTADDKKVMKALPDYGEETGLVIDVDAVGFSLCLIKRELFQKVSAPYFITGLNHTEDVYFCLKARDADPGCTIVVDTTLKCGHILWSEIISSHNKKDYKEYFEKQNPSVLEQEEGTKLEIKRVESTYSYENVIRDEMADFGKVKSK